MDPAGAAARGATRLSRLASAACPASIPLLQVDAVAPAVPPGAGVGAEPLLVVARAPALAARPTGIVRTAQAGVVVAAGTERSC